MNNTADKTTPQQPGFFTGKSVLLTLISIVVIVAFANMPPYNEWKNHLGSYYDDYQKQKEDLSVEYRMQQYYGQAYNVSNNIKKAIEMAKFKNALILFPPNAYCEKLNVSFRFPEPAIFYYYTGLHAIWMGSPLMPKATHVIRVMPAQIEVIPVKQPSDITNFINFYKPYLHN